MSRLMTCTMLSAALCVLPVLASAQWQTGPALDRGLEYRGEFRVINWNAAALDPNMNWNARPEVDPAEVADFILENVGVLDANVLTLQEMSAEAYAHLVFGLGHGWDCHAAFIGLVDLRVTCVKGVGTNFRARRLANHAAFGTEDYPPDLQGIEWWGYTQIEYLGVLITNVHTRSKWKSQHLAQLHAEVGSGIVAGDFNHPQPEGPDWHQTDPIGAPTLRGRACNGCEDYVYDKVDHILTVGANYAADGDVIGLEWPPAGGSNHKMIWARFRLHETITRAAQPRPVRARRLESLR